MLTDFSFLQDLAEAAVGAVVGTFAGGYLVWKLEQNSQQKREAEDLKIRAMERKRNLQLKKSEFIASALPRIFISQYGDARDASFFRSHFFECYHVFEASKNFFESMSAKEMTPEIDELYGKHYKEMKEDPSLWGTDVRKFRDRKANCEDYARKIHEAFQIELAYLFSEVVSDANISCRDKNND